MFWRKKKEEIELDAQTLMDFAVFKIVEQGKRAINDGVCTYLDKEGNRCLIGWLLGDAVTKIKDRNFSLRALILKHPKILPQAVKDNEGLFSTAQTFHDCADKEGRKLMLNQMSKYIDTSAPQYQQWIDLGR